jgi:hypothetical protein
MSHVGASAMPHLTIGLDLGDKRSQLFRLAAGRCRDDERGASIP